VKCFSCANFGIVDDPHDIWRLLSFEKRLNEAMLAHQNVKHFLNNYGEVKAKLNKLKEQFKKAHLKAAEAFGARMSPLWDEESVMDIFRG
jgi:Ran GTPase-activating protein (RanGAP) involved in mRNA processing and transport